MYTISKGPSQIVAKTRRGKPIRLFFFFITFFTHVAVSGACTDRVQGSFSSKRSNSWLEPLNSFKTMGKKWKEETKPFLFGTCPNDVVKTTFFPSLSFFAYAFHFVISFTLVLICVCLCNTRVTGLAQKLESLDTIRDMTRKSSDSDDMDSPINSSRFHH